MLPPPPPFLGRAVLALACLAEPRLGAAQQEQLDAAAVNAAIGRGVEFLLASQNRDGSWGVDLQQRAAWQDWRNGSSGFALFTLLKCGLPADHPAIEHGLAFLLREMPRHTYATAVQIMALAATGDPAHRQRIEDLVERLLDYRAGSSKGWGYPGCPPLPADLSNTQYAALGLRAAREAGIEIPRKAWNALIEAALFYQEGPIDLPPREDSPRVRRSMAGFFYFHGEEHPPSASMTTAGLSVLGVAAEALGKLPSDAELARDRGLAWLEQHFSVEGNPLGDQQWHFFYLYGLERVGALFALERIGTQDWYQAGARRLLKEQREQGGWWTEVGIRPPMPVANTCFALLFLRRATLTQQPQASRPYFFVAEDPSSQVWIRADAQRIPWSIWLSGFGPSVAERFGAGGFSIQRVEYFVDGTLAASLSPPSPSLTERFAIQHEPERGGDHVVECRVTVTGSSGSGTAELRSARVTIPRTRVLEPWMFAYAEAEAENLLREIPNLVASASSLESGLHPAQDAADGLQGSAWIAARGDPEPWIALDLGSGVRAREIVLSPAGASEFLRERYGIVRAVEIRLNGDSKPIRAALDPDVRLKTAVQLDGPTLVRRLEVRIVEAEREKPIGLAEIELR